MSGWWLRALCRTHRSPDLWYDPVFVEQAKAICRRCPVQSECLADAIEHGETKGIWGGLLPAERAVRRLSVNDRERALVLSEIGKGARSVADLRYRIGIDAETTRRHLYSLEQAGEIRIERDAARRLVVAVS